MKSIICLYAAVWENLASVLPSLEWRTMNYTKLLLDRASSHTVVIAPLRTPWRRELMFNHWNPLRLQLQSPVDSSPCYPTRSQREAVLCSPEVWEALTLQGPEVSLSCWTWNLTHRRQALHCCFQPVETAVQTPPCYTAEAQLKASRDSLLH